MKHSANKPCPKPGEMLLIKSKEGDFYRMKRSKEGDIAAMKHEGMAASKELLKVLSPAAARLVGELRPYMTRMSPGRINIRVKSCLQRSLKERGELDYSYMESLEFQPEYPLWRLMKYIPGLAEDGEDVVVHIPIPDGGAVNAYNTLVTGYKFTLIMVVGDVVRGDKLRTYDVSSPKYQTGKEVKGGCELRLIRPDEGERWVCVLSIISYEGKNAANSPRHAGMKVVGWG